ncbi:AAA family ATPase [candidate division WOR-3 bacterium]|nr:AAA family ATPase [candidate division WOR-3 bacterium]
MSFNNIIGQEIPKKILISALKSQRIANAYLFYGPNGVGKTLTAKTFAQALNCEESKYDSCDICTTCRDIDNQRNPDFEIIIPNEKGNIGIDQIRAIKERSSYRSCWLKYRVTVIREADKLGIEASNAFLKILEEPPPHTIFILTASKKHILLPTIVSRCQEIRFRKLKSQEIEGFINSIAKAKAFGYKSAESIVPEGGTEVLKLCSRLANGSIVRALDLLKPEENKLRTKVFNFLNSSSLERMRKVRGLELFDGINILLFIQSLYMDLLYKDSGVLRAVKNTDFNFKESYSTEEILKAIILCEEVSHALKQNVHKKFALYYLSKELP